MASADYEGFRDALIARHTNPTTSRIQILGDVLLVGSVPAGVARRSVKVGIGTFIVGYLVAVVAHMFDPRTLREELTANGRHPIWGARAEMERVSGVLRSAWV